MKHLFLVLLLISTLSWGIGAEANISNVVYEDARTCSKDRLYFETGLKKMPDFMKKLRPKQPEAELPLECMVHTQKNFMSSAQKGKSRFFAACQGPNASPVRGSKIHCLTEEYMNSVYNAFVDVTDCLNLPQKDLYIKLSHESGFHINTFGGNGDTGIGQMTGVAITEVVRSMQRTAYPAEFKESKKSSCQRILQTSTTMQKVNPDIEQRCNLIHVPESPYRNMMYAGLYNRTLMMAIAGISYVGGRDVIIQADGSQVEIKEGQDFEPAGYIGKYQMKKNLKLLGIEKPDMHALVRALVMLGYNTGPGKASEYFSVYLKKRLAQKAKLKSSDVDFLVTDFVKNWQKHTLAYMRTKSANATLSAGRKNGHMKSLPEFLMVIQESGAPGYLSYIAEKHKAMIETMGDKRCVSDKYLHL